VAEPLKAAYTREYILQLGRAIVSHYPAFPVQRFQRAVFDRDWDGRELKARLGHIRACLHEYLDLPYTAALDVLMAAAPAFGGYHAMFFPDYVEAYGLDHWQPSMRALAFFTRHSSSEFAVRPFIVRDPERMLKQMQVWSRDKNEHLRRLASEGSRPRLPWAMALPQFKRDPAPILPILEQLRTDPSLYVRRSVANNLNDIAKDNPDVTLAVATRWAGSHPDTDWIIKHACRSLLKKAHPQALKLFSFAPVTHVAVKRLQLTASDVAIGGELEFDLQLIATDRPSLGRLRLEYGIDYMKSNGKPTRKIFKIAEGEFDEAERRFRKRHSLRQMTSRKHYPGRHRLVIIVNGDVVKERLFNLTEASR
jgi:3-methyladenine DNA glycosylase AlkC